ncbi:MAG: hypothetical protein CMO26_13705 [Thiotrichales bacterium]|nr:hypothetical protein [Thiotrichales bacterium]|tara:strand:+ start:486 stop:1190 length:705 start_codon:yes stop_codon:yes gene_type:complete
MTSKTSKQTPVLGILVLDTGFPRIRGDVGNSSTFNYPVMLKTVSGATPTEVTGPNVERLLDAFASGAAELIEQDAAGITTTCGFLAVLQPRLAARCTVPFAASSLLQVPSVQATLPAGRRVGIITFSAQLLTAAHLQGAGVPADTPLEGLAPDSAFYRMIIEGHDHIDVEQAERDVVAAGQRLIDQHPEIGAIVVECANMPPYSAALRDALDLPIYDPLSFLDWFYASLSPRAF